MGGKLSAVKGHRPQPRMRLASRERADQSIWDNRPRFPVSRATLRIGKFRGAEPHTKLVWMSTPAASRLPRSNQTENFAIRESSPTAQTAP